MSEQDNFSNWWINERSQFGKVSLAKGKTVDKSHSSM